MAAGDATPNESAPIEESQPLAEETARELEELRALLEETKDRALRSQAELENYRKRVARQMEEERRYAALPLIRDLLPVWDNIQRAIESAEKKHDLDALLEGVKMTARQLEMALERHHCTKIDALRQPFDPHMHHAIAQQPSAEFPPNTVLVEAQTGFRLHDRVVRPSQVVISVGAPQPAAQAEGQAGGDGQAPATNQQDSRQGVQDAPGQP